MGARARGRGRARRLRPHRPQDPLQGLARRAPRGRPASALRAPVDGQLQPVDGAPLHRSLALHGARRLRRRRGRALQPAHRLLAPPSWKRFHVAPLGLHERIARAHRSRDGASARKRPHRREDERARRRDGHQGALPRVAGGRADRSHRARHLLPAPRRARHERQHPRDVASSIASSSTRASSASRTAASARSTCRRPTGCRATSTAASRSCSPSTTTTLRDRVVDEILAIALADNVKARRAARRRHLRARPARGRRRRRAQPVPLHGARARKGAGGPRHPGRGRRTVPGSHDAAAARHAGGRRRAAAPPVVAAPASRRPRPVVGEVPPGGPASAQTRNPLGLSLPPRLGAPQGSESGLSAGLASWPEPWPGIALLAFVVASRSSRPGSTRRGLARRRPRHAGDGRALRPHRRRRRRLRERRPGTASTSGSSRRDRARRRRGLEGPDDARRPPHDRAARRHRGRHADDGLRHDALFTRRARARLPARHPGAATSSAWRRASVCSRAKRPRASGWCAPPTRRAPHSCA